MKPPPCNTWEDIHTSTDKKPHTHSVSPTITDKGDKNAFRLPQNSIKLSQNLTELDEKASVPFLHSIRKKS